MKNFGFHKLILINPKDDPKSKYAYGFAMHVQEILDNAKVIYNNNREEDEGLKNSFKDLIW